MTATPAEYAMERIGLVLDDYCGEEITEKQAVIRISRIVGSYEASK